MKARKGNAYIMVMVATMAVLMLVVTALLITANSRQITGRYPDFFGLYDLAIGGNEYGIFLLNEGTWATNELPSRVWTVEAEFGMGDGYVVQDIYHARTQVLPASSQNFDYMVETVIYKVVDGIPGPEVTVRAQIYLDDYGYTMVELVRQE